MLQRLITYSGDYLAPTGACPAPRGTVPRSKVPAMTWVLLFLFLFLLTMLHLSAEAGRAHSEWCRGVEWAQRVRAAGGSLEDPSAPPFVRYLRDSGRLPEIVQQVTRAATRPFSQPNGLLRRDPRSVLIAQLVQTHAVESTLEGWILVGYVEGMGPVAAAS